MTSTTPARRPPIDRSGAPAVIAHAGGVTLALALWAHWAEIAVDAEGAAGRSRAAGLLAGETTGEVATPLFEEFKASLVAISATAHALDALYGQLANGEVKLGERNGWSRHLRIRTCLHKRFVIANDVCARWRASDFPWLFRLRDSAVHPSYEHLESVLHPSGLVNTSPWWSDYSIEACSRAIDLLFEVLRACFAKPRNADLDAVVWASNHAAILGQLERRRRDGPPR